jgi:PAS domain S-box-containing protein
MARHNGPPVDPPDPVPDLLFEAAPDAVVVVDGDGRITRANTRCCHLFGYPAGELIGQSVEVLVPAAQRPAHLDHRTNYAARPRARVMGDPGARLQAQRADGECIPVDIALSPVEVGGRSMVMAVIRDLSERVAAEADLETTRRDAEERLRASEAAFRSAFDDAVVPMAIVDLEDPPVQAIVRANDSLASLLDVTLDDLVGASSVALVHPDDREVYVGRARTLARHDPSHHIDLRLRRRDGSYRWATVNASRLSAEAVPGGTLALVHVIDITRRVEAEGERDRREELLRALARVRKASLDERPTDDVLQLIVEAVRHTLAARLAFIATPDPSGALRVRTSDDAPRWDLSGTTLPEGSVAARVMKTSEIEVVPAPAGLRPLVGEGQGADMGRAVGSIVVVPLHTANSVEGILAMARSPKAGPFTEDDLIAARSLAAEAAVSLVLARARDDRRRMLLVEDRERIARDLHDVVIQRLYATGMRLQAALGRPEVLAERAPEVVSDLDDTIESVRNAIFELGQPDNTVGGELQRMIDRHRVTGRSRLILEIDGDLERLDQAVVNHLLPTVNELVSNVERHADATTATVIVVVAEQRLTVTVADDGIGLRPGTTQGFGLRNLTERAMLLGGNLEYGETPGAGSRIHWSVPLT